MRRTRGRLAVVVELPPGAGRPLAGGLGLGRPLGRVGPRRVVCRRRAAPCWSVAETTPISAATELRVQFRPLGIPPDARKAMVAAVAWLASRPRSGGRGRSGGPATRPGRPPVSHRGACSPAASWAW